MPSPLEIGVDVAKDCLQVAFANAAMPEQAVENRSAAIKAWLAKLPKGSRVAMEATGCYRWPPAPPTYAWW